MFYNFIIGGTLLCCGFEEILVPRKNVVSFEWDYLEFSLKSPYVEKEEGLINCDPFKFFTRFVRKSFSIKLNVTTTVIGE